MNGVERGARDAAVEWVEDADRAANLLHPLRLEIVRLAAEPKSAAAIADELGLPRQRVNYHVRELAKAGLLRRAGTRRKRNMIERLFVASASSYLLAPSLLGAAAPDVASEEPIAAGTRVADPAVRSTGSATDYLLAVAARSQQEVASAAREAAARDLALPALTLATEIRFESARQRKSFVDALATAVAEVVATHSSPARTAGGEPGPGRAHRLVTFCHPIPANNQTTEEAKNQTEETKNERAGRE